MSDGLASDLGANTFTRIQSAIKKAGETDLVGQTDVAAVSSQYLPTLLTLLELAA
jgi:hypothetical protein